MIGDGVQNRVVVHLPDDMVDFLAAQSVESGLSRSHAIRQAIAHYRRAVERSNAIEEAVHANEAGAY